jgi:hypothetical protein
MREGAEIKQKRMACHFRNFSHNFVEKSDQEAIYLEEGRRIHE